MALLQYPLPTHRDVDVDANKRLLASLPKHVDGRRLQTVQHATAMSNTKFAALLGVSTEWLRRFVCGQPAILSRARIETQLGVARAMRKLGIRLTPDGWERLTEEEKSDV